ncbi:hypothetical protein [Desulfonatronum thioautotrophicum]|uniref:hypothetical protein n=1 Tax=Desulfonatronum thioautotrophicum TaxID=617001 RepID=UPI0005EB3D4B|nr:hypothetical protein [Desulfonatronum thioautotrophicum]
MEFLRIFYFKIKKRIIYTLHQINIFFTDKFFVVNNESSNALRKKVLEIDAKSFVGTSSWEVYRSELRKDILEKNIRNFLNWPVIKKTMFYQAPEIEYIQVANNDSFFDAITESILGNPLPYYINTKTSGNLVHHAYSVLQLIRSASIKMSNFNQVIEVGGGYGSMCRLFRNSGFFGHYIIYDLPEFLALQEYYISSVNKQYANNTVFTNDVSELSKYKKQGTVLIATWSLSEMPLDLRSLLLKNIDFDYCLIAYQSHFDNIDNIKYFDVLAKNYYEIDFINYPIDHLPGNNYLIGFKKKLLSK